MSKSVEMIHEFSFINAYFELLKLQTGSKQCDLLVPASMGLLQLENTLRIGFASSAPFINSMDLLLKRDYSIGYYIPGYARGRDAVFVRSLCNNQQRRPCNRCSVLRIATSNTGKHPGAPKLTMRRNEGRGGL